MSFFSCKNEQAAFEIIGEKTQPLINSGSDTLGLVAPGPQSFINYKISLPDNNNQRIFYKIFYRNESYLVTVDSTLTPDTIPDLSENFYGVCGPLSGFDSSISNTINGKFKIAGNPLNDTLYFGKTFTYFPDTNPDIKEIKQKISSNPDWLAAVKKKALASNVPLNNQLYLDANFVLNDGLPKVNQRWKRNPRVGEYSFLIVYTTNKEALEKLPDYILDPSKPCEYGYRVDPFWYFLNRHEKSDDGIAFHYFPNQLNLKYNYNAAEGIRYNDTTGNNQAHFEPYFHHLDTTTFRPTVVNQTDFENFTYQANAQHTVPGGIYPMQLKDSSIVCEPGRIRLENKFQVSSNRSVKKSVGIQGTQGITYGKFTAKIKFPSLINNQMAWNGLTNAFWLLYQSDEPWNHRSICDSLGYIPKEDVGDYDSRREQLSYSEIDFEIVKASKYWPETSYPNNYFTPPVDANPFDDSIVVACTNWDLACPEPNDYVVGAVPHVVGHDTSYLHRWDHSYQALTTKIARKNAELFTNEYYYYQFEWTPTEIIWRIGPEKSDLTPIARMTHRETVIPNNQMIPVITQEFHQTEWWPTNPYKQENIPAFSKSLVGYVYEVTVE